MQRKRLLKISIAIVLFTLLWILFAPGHGLYFLHKQKKYLAELQVEQQILMENNRKLAEDVERLQNDQAYLEKIAREEHGMLKENEMVFDFSKKKKKK